MGGGGGEVGGMEGGGARWEEDKVVESGWGVGGAKMRYSHGDDAVPDR